MLKVICAHIWQPDKKDDSISVCDICNTQWNKDKDVLPPRVVIGQVDESVLLTALKN